MLRRLPALLQPYQQRRALRQRGRRREASIQCLGLKVCQCEIHGQLRKGDRLLPQRYTFRLSGLQPKLHARRMQIAIRQAVVRQDTVNARTQRNCPPIAVPLAGDRP